MWLETARQAGFTDVIVVRRRPMTVERLKRYPVYQEGLLAPVFALVPPEQHDSLVWSALIVARPGELPTGATGAPICQL